MRVAVIYAGREHQIAVTLELDEAATVADALAAAGRLHEFGALDLAGLRVGIFGMLVTSKTSLRDGDRVEIYRPLLVDPKEARARRSRKKAAGPARGR